MTDPVYKVKKLLSFEITYFYHLEEKGVGILPFNRRNSEMATSEHVINFRVFGEIDSDQLDESIEIRNTIFNKLQSKRIEYKTKSGFKYWLSLCFPYDKLDKHNDLGLSTPFSIRINYQDEGNFLSPEDQINLQEQVYQLIDNTEGELNCLVSELRFLHPKSYIEAIRLIDYFE